VKQQKMDYHHLKTGHLKLGDFRHSYDCSCQPQALYFQSLCGQNNISASPGKKLV